MANYELLVDPNLAVREIGDKRVRLRISRLCDGADLDCETVMVPVEVVPFLRVALSSYQRLCEPTHFQRLTV